MPWNRYKPGYSQPEENRLVGFFFFCLCTVWHFEIKPVYLPILYKFLENKIVS